MIAYKADVIRAEMARLKIKDDGIKGLHRVTVGELKRGEAKNPTLDTLLKVAAALNLPLSALVSDKPVKTAA